MLFAPGGRDVLGGSAVGVSGGGPLAAAGWGRGGGRGVLGFVVDFWRLGLRAVLIDGGVGYDGVEAGVAVGGDDLLAAGDRAQALSVFAGRPNFARLYVAYDRASRIL